MLLSESFFWFCYLAVGTVADKIINPFGAMIVGSVAGALSTVGFRFIKPVLQKFKIHDTCGVNNLHGMPGLLAGIFGILLAIFPAYSLHTDNLLGGCFYGDARPALAQVGFQAAALGVTIGLAVVGGLITGFILRIPALNDEYPSALFNDHVHWETPDDFNQDVNTVLLPAQAPPHL